jgi:hypothetical protein
MRMAEILAENRRVPLIEPVAHHRGAWTRAQIDLVIREGERLRRELGWEGSGA